MIIPRTPLILGLSGVLPFIWGAATATVPSLHDWSMHNLSEPLTGSYMVFVYGAVILSFMSGALWGLATKLDERKAATGYALSVIPALWVFFTAGAWSDFTGIALIIGFLGILMIDWFFWRIEAAPEWWMRLRLILTFVVVACLVITVISG